MKRKTQHAKILKAIRELLRYHNIWHYKHSGGPFSKLGVADLIGILKTKNGKSLAIEVKVPGDKPTKKQAEFLKDVVDNGGIGLVAHSTEEVIKALHLPDLLFNNGSVITTDVLSVQFQAHADREHNTEGEHKI